MKWYEINLEIEILTNKSKKECYRYYEETSYGSRQDGNIHISKYDEVTKMVLVLDMIDSY